MEDLIKRVREIDPAAADWMESDDKDIETPNFISGSNTLMGIMMWSLTPQGYVYWMEIARQLGEEF